MATFQTLSATYGVGAKQPPVQRIGRGDIQVLVWANQAWDGGTVFKATVSRRYRRRDGSWASTGSFRKQELEEVIDVLKLACEEMRE